MFSLLINPDLLHCCLLLTFVRICKHACKSDPIFTFSVPLWPWLILPIHLSLSKFITLHLLTFPNSFFLFFFLYHLPYFTFFPQGLFLFTGTCILVELCQSTVQFCNQIHLTHANKTTKMFKEFPVIAQSERELFLPRPLSGMRPLKSS